MVGKVEEGPLRRFADCAPDAEYLRKQVSREKDAAAAGRIVGVEPRHEDVEVFAMLEVVDMPLHRFIAVMLVGYDGVGEYHRKRQNAEECRNCTLVSHRGEDSDYLEIFT